LTAGLVIWMGKGGLVESRLWLHERAFLRRFE
jgi:hypothetical protein